MCKGQKGNKMEPASRVAEEGLFCADWTAREELQLLEAVEEFSYGNW